MNIPKTNSLRNEALICQLMTVPPAIVSKSLAKSVRFIEIKAVSAK